MSNYKKALVDAQREMAEIDGKLASLQSRRAQLETTIAGLKTLMGEPLEETDHTLSSAVRSILMGSNAKDRFMGITEMMTNIRLLRPQRPVNQTSLRTILHRMVESGEIKQGNAPNGSVGYAWKRSAFYG